MEDNNSIEKKFFESDELDLKELSNALWNKKIFISSITMLVTTFSLVIALSLPNIYLSNALLVPTSTNDSLSSKLAGFSSLAGVAGISLPAENANPSQEAIQRIKSFSFFRKYFLPNIKLENLLAIKKWSPEDGVIYKDNIYDPSSKQWVRKFSYPKKQIPSDQEAYKKYKEILSITEDKKTSFVSISIKHHSPILAKKWVEIVIKNINESMREDDRERAKKSINYLNESSKSINIQSLKEALTNLLENQMQTLMLASANKDYIYKTLEAPVAPEDNHEPNRVVILFFGFFLGFILSIFLALVRHYKET